MLPHKFSKNITGVPWPSCNISTVLCRAVSGMPPTRWRGVGIHQHTGKWEWGLNNRALSHCHSARSVGRLCLESAILVTGIEKNRGGGEKKYKQKRLNSGSRHHWEDSTWLFSFVLSKTEKSHSMKLSGWGAAPRARALTHSIPAWNMIQLTASVERTRWQRRISASKNLWMLESRWKGQEAKSCFAVNSGFQLR